MKHSWDLPDWDKLHLSLLMYKSSVSAELYLGGSSSEWFAALDSATIVSNPALIICSSSRFTLSVLIHTGPDKLAQQRTQPASYLESLVLQHLLDCNCLACLQTAGLEYCAEGPIANNSFCEVTDDLFIRPKTPNSSNDMSNIIGIAFSYTTFKYLRANTPLVDKKGLWAGVPKQELGYFTTTPLATYRFFALALLWAEPKLVKSLRQRIQGGCFPKNCWKEVTLAVPGLSPKS